MTNRFEFRIWEKPNSDFMGKHGNCFHYPEGQSGYNFAIGINGHICSGYIDGDMTTTGNDGFIAQQFTGLLDKNGKKIFEGDIVSGILTEKEYNFVVSFKDGTFNVSNKWFDNYCLCDLTNRKIVGDIYSNPQLLE